MAATQAARAEIDDTDVAREVADLEARLAQAKERLRLRRGHAHNGVVETLRFVTPSGSTLASTNHFLLLLSDSALPLGSFAFSSGLESYLAHAAAAARDKTGSSRLPSFAAFLPISVASYASTTLPFVLAAHRSCTCAGHDGAGNGHDDHDDHDDDLTAHLAALDDALDATIICTVGRRASVAQGRALLSVWERSFASSTALPRGAASALRPFSLLLKSGASTEAGGGQDDLPPVSAHLGPLFGAVAGLVGLSARQTGYVFVLAHVKALVSAAVRAGVFGPYQAQRLLASATVQELVDAAVEREWDTPPEEAGQSVPVMDLWVGRHEVLYSRIFNS